MSSQQFPRSGAPPAGLGPAPPPGPTSGSAGLIAPAAAATVSDDSGRDSEVAPREHLGPGGSIQPREEKQEPVVVRPYPQVQMLTQHHPVQSAAPVTVTAPPAHLTPAVPLSFSDGLMKPPLKPTMPSRPIAPAPPSTLSAPTKVPGQVTVTMESNIPQAPTIPVATISGQQGHPSNLHHIMATNVQMSIIRSSAPGPPLHIGASHLPRGAAAAAVMSSSKVTTVLRPASQLPNAATAQPAVQHIIHQPIQAVSSSRDNFKHYSSSCGGNCLGHKSSVPCYYHNSSTCYRINPQKTIFSTGTPVAAATVAPILATNTIASATTAGSVSHTQAPTSTIVTMTMPSHSSHATAVTTSNIPVAKVVPQQITHTSPRIQSDYTAERSNLIPLSSHRASPNPVAMETRNDNRQSVPVQFQYFLPTYPPSAYPLTAHTYTPITSSVSTIRQYPVFDDLLAEGKTHGQGVLNYVRDLLNTGNNSFLRSFTFDIQGFPSLDLDFHATSVSAGSMLPLSSVEGMWKDMEVAKTNLEHDVYERLTALQEGLIPKKKAATDDDLHRINELIQGNMQRCKLVMDQINEARDSMLKVLDHKDRVLKLLNKNGTVKKVSKLKRKEKV
ncbi:hypothetical protein llap_14993 [Limosa lapponica baueri]|uniref:Histone deacetylase complex subunit SAP130 C-terminal domain-containing protein n=1 Tax=Limosa lapponica baueri TaxID=1758121 RepID=A0A2I0TLK5_LIMLA|nr:hypothetical protein llap_14993 [Limosa lapponica baueri]